MCTTVHEHIFELIPLHYSAIATYLCLALRNQVVGLAILHITVQSEFKNALQE